MSDTTETCDLCSLTPCGCAVVLRVCKAAYEQGRRDGERGFKGAASVAMVASALRGDAAKDSTAFNSPESGAVDPGLFNDRVTRRESEIRERHSETCPRISDPGSQTPCLVCDVFGLLHRERNRLTFDHPPEHDPLRCPCCLRYGQRIVDESERADEAEEALGEIAAILADDALGEQTPRERVEAVLQRRVSE